MFFARKEKIHLESLRPLFDSQKKTLIEKDYPAMLMMKLEDFNANLNQAWKFLSLKINTVEIIIKGNLPLLIVVEHGNVQEKIRRMQGHTELDFNKIVPDTHIPSHPFSILLDVEDGATMIAKSTQQALKKFRKEKRSALTLSESISLLTHHPEILKNHYVISAGTSYDKDGSTYPLLWLLDSDGNPELHYAWFDIAHGSYGAGSSAIKIDNV